MINYKGTIAIDGVDVMRMSRETLRERLTAIPQDTVFLAGDVRLNCDPRCRSTDEQIIEALRAAKLWDAIEAKGGLDAELSDSTLSKGQQQLFSLARALLDHCQIVAMDEASSRLVYAISFSFTFYIHPFTLFYEHRSGWCKQTKYTDVLLVSTPSRRLT